MKSRYNLTLHVFRRDLRLEDNKALQEALSESERVIACFIFDTRQIDQNAYRSSACIEFMARSLVELDEALKARGSQLYCFYGIAEEVIGQLLDSYPIEAIYVNRDYTPFSRKRDERIEAVCQQHQVAFNSHADALLTEPEQVYKADGQPYTVFTPFYLKASQVSVAPPRKNVRDNFYQGDIAFKDTITLNKLLKNSNPNLIVKGGRQEGLGLIKKIAQLTDYDHTRNLPALNGTTKLSAHHKFGTVSIREVYAEIAKRFGPGCTLIRELYWRDFFTHITFHFPRVMGGAFHERYNQLSWENNPDYFKAWCEGKTGFPIVDAGMRELNATGYMHNRVRMITASFLVKDLHVDWRWGEKYFAQQLVDYDPAVNNGNWQWAASTGCDAQPYFRIFNPTLQQEKFDPDFNYVKKWVPELNNPAHYPAPIVNHRVESQKTKELYSSI